MKTLFRNSIHTSGKSHDCLICEINGKKIKITYEAYNACERCNTEVFDGYKWNHFLSMLDMGIESNSSAYIADEKKRKLRATECFKKAETMCLTILEWS